MQQKLLKFTGREDRIKCQSILAGWSRQDRAEATVFCQILL
jgi:hypothetical protein